jgi:predicted nucleotidyltransferase
MISSEQIQQAVERLVAAANPSKVILFGSYARGDATEDSDLDLMVIEQEVHTNHGVKSFIITFVKFSRLPSGKAGTLQC